MSGFIQGEDRSQATLFPERLEREAQRNIELIWLTGRLAPDFKTIADFRKDNGVPICLVCRQFVEAPVPDTAKYLQFSSFFAFSNRTSTLDAMSDCKRLTLVLSQ